MYMPRASRASRSHMPPASHEPGAATEKARLAVASASSARNHASPPICFSRARASAFSTQARAPISTPKKTASAASTGRDWVTAASASAAMMRMA